MSSLNMKGLLCLTLFLVFTSINASFEDTRCKCTCEYTNNKNGSSSIDGSAVHRKKSFIKTVPPENCICKKMLNEEDFKLCPLCSCKYQTRNTTTIKVVVCMIVIIILALTIYMVFLLILEPLLSQRFGLNDQFMGMSPATRGGLHHASTSVSSGQVYRRKGVDGRFVEDHDNKAAEWNNDEIDSVYNVKDTVPIANTSKCDQAGGIELTKPTSVSEVVTRARDQQKKWIGNVEAQRVRVFNNHSLLN